jgi:predicted metal-dependent peptidase
MWELGKPVFTNVIDIAAVSFDEQGDVLLFSFNPDFWDKLSVYERQFIISHECLHVILNHGLRVFNAKNKDFANIAADIVVNHMLVNKFAFLRENIKELAEKFNINKRYIYKIINNERWKVENLNESKTTR